MNRELKLPMVGWVIQKRGIPKPAEEGRTRWIFGKVYRVVLIH